jgi:transcriptional regulator with XRE-family HTH domain
VTDFLKVRRFSARLRQFMDANHISGAELGRRLGNVDPSLVSRWRNGRDRPVPETVVKIADLFGEDHMTWLQLAGWLTDDAGAEPDVDPHRSALLVLLRQVPDKDLATLERVIRAFIEPPRPR